MGKRRADESETEYIKRKLRRLEKKLEKLPSESARLRDSPSSSPAHSLSPPPIQKRTSKKTSTNTEETPEDLPEDSESSKKDENIEDLVIEEEAVPEELLLALGKEGVETEERGPDIQQELATRWKKLMAKGLGKEDLEHIVKKYPAPANFCSEAPKVNPEILASLSEISQKRDKRITHRQNIVLKILNALGKTLTSILKGNIHSNLIVEQVHDAAKLCTEIFFEDTSSRQFFALSGTNQTVKEAIRESKPDEFLFGNDCADKIKAAQAIRKTGAQIKISEHIQPSTSNSTKTAKQPQPKRQGNWRGPPQQYQHQRARGGHRQPPTMRKYSQPHPNRQDHRRQQHRGRHTYRR